VRVGITDHMPPAPEGKGNRCLPFAQNIPLPAIRFSEKHDEDLGELFHSAISPQPDAQHDLGFFSKILQQFLELHPKHRAQVDDISKRWVEIFQIEFEQAFETLYKLTCTICDDHESKTTRRVRTETETSYATSVLTARIAPSVTRPSLLISSTGRCVGRVTRRSRGTSESRAQKRKSVRIAASQSLSVTSLEIV
jgi:hypothetical protein